MERCTCAVLTEEGAHTDPRCPLYRVEVEIDPPYAAVVRVDRALLDIRDQFDRMADEVSR